MEKEEILQLAQIKVAQAAQLLQKAGEELLGEEAEAMFSICSLTFRPSLGFLDALRSGACLPWEPSPPRLG